MSYVESHVSWNADFGRTIAISSASQISSLDKIALKPEDWVSDLAVEYRSKSQSELTQYILFIYTVHEILLSALQRTT